MSSIIRIPPSPPSFTANLKKVCEKSAIHRNSHAWPNRNFEHMKMITIIVENSINLSDNFRNRITITKCCNVATWALTTRVRVPTALIQLASKITNKWVGAWGGEFTVVENCALKFCSPPPRIRMPTLARPLPIKLKFNPQAKHCNGEHCCPPPLKLFIQTLPPIKTSMRTTGTSTQIITSVQWAKK